MVDKPRLGSMDVHGNYSITMYNYMILYLMFMLLINQRTFHWGGTTLHAYHLEEACDVFDGRLLGVHGDP